MAIRYFRLEQAYDGSSPVTGDTIVMKWDDTVIPSGFNQALTLTFMGIYPNATWSFRSRVWDITDLGTTSIPFDTEMISGEPWGYVSTNGTRVYVGFTFDIETTIFAQNYIPVITGISTTFSPRYYTNFYSASTFNDPSKVIGTDTNRYDWIKLNTQADYDHITSSGLTTYDFASADSVTSQLDIVFGQYAYIPYSTTSALTYFNTLYDGWVSEYGDCSGNVYSSGYSCI